MTRSEKLPRRIRTIAKRSASQLSNSGAPGRPQPAAGLDPYSRHLEQLVNDLVSGDLHDVEKLAQSRSEVVMSNAFDLDPTDPELWPRLLILDASPLGGGSATGMLLASEFRGWPVSRLLQVSSADSRQLKLHRLKGADIAGHPVDVGQAAGAIETFQPDLIFFRPDSRSWPLIELWNKIDDGTTPVALNIVDDWLARISDDNPGEYVKWDQAIESLAARSSQGWAISGVMAEDLAQRYGLEFDVISNMAELGDWTPGTDLPNGAVHFHYAAWPANRKGGNSLNQLALVLSKQDPTKTSLQMCIPDHGDSKIYGEIFANLKNVNCRPWTFGQEYRNFLESAGINVVTFNFDKTTIGYLSHSFANRIPELMASGRPILVIGPRELLSVRYLEASGAAILIEEPEIEEIERVVQALLADAPLRQRLSAAAKAEAKRFDAAEVRPLFHAKLIGAARGYSLDPTWTTNPLERVIDRPETHVAGPAKVLHPADFAFGPFLRGDAVFDETALVKKVFDAKGISDMATMVDVGAHVGGALEGFGKGGWVIYAFEPDENNRSRLEQSIDRHWAVTIDPRAVAPNSGETVSFFRSCLLYTSPSPRDQRGSRMPSSA